MLQSARRRQQRANKKRSASTFEHQRLRHRHFWHNWFLWWNQNRNHSHESCHQIKQHNRMTVTSLRVAIGQIKLSANNTNHVRKRLKVSSMSRCHDLRCQLLRTVPATVQINTLRNPKIKFRRAFLPKVLDANSLMFTDTRSSSSLPCRFFRYDATTPQIKTMRDASV